MDISQSHFQSILSRAFETIGNLAWYIIISIAAGLMFQNSSNITVVISTCVFVILAFFLITILFAIFVPKPYRRLYFFECGFDFYTFDRKRKVHWKQVIGYKKTKLFPYKFIIIIDGFEDVEFAYYSFSSSQRKIIKQMIDENS